MNIDARMSQQDKVRDFKEMKQDIDSRVGPGAYYNNKTFTEFKQIYKPEVH